MRESDVTSPSERDIPEHDERIMCDGRPAWAWWNEIQMARADRASLKRDRAKVDGLMRLLSVARVDLEKDRDANLVVTITRLDMVKAPGMCRTLADVIDSTYAARSTR